MKQLSLVSKDIHSAAAEILWRSVTITFGDEAGDIKNFPTSPLPLIHKVHIRLSSRISLELSHLNPRHFILRHVSDALTKYVTTFLKRLLKRLGDRQLLTFRYLIFLLGIRLSLKFANYANL
jgi:hypothetical protein